VLRQKAFHIVSLSVFMPIPAGPAISRDAQAKDAALEIMREAMRVLPFESGQPPIIVEADRIVQTVTREV
jgi:hypothetical protein